MSKFKINSITDKTGTSGPVIAGVSTNNSTGCMIIPAGPTEHRGGRGRGVIGGGSLIPAGTAVNTLNLITIATTGDAIDFGDLTDARDPAVTSSLTRGIACTGDYPSNVNIIDFIEILTTANAVDFGDMTTKTSSAQTFQMLMEVLLMTCKINMIREIIK